MLEKLTDTSIETQRKWLNFILERVGSNNLARLLEYYTNIGWISDSVAEKLSALAEQEKQYEGNSWTLSADEHRISRLYIEKLKGRQIDDSILTFPPGGSSVLDSRKRIEIKHGKSIPSVHPAEKKKMEFAIHRREVTISNLEEELEERDVEIEELNEKIEELGALLDECQKEVMRNRIYMDILDQNIKLRKADRMGRKGSGKK